MKQIFYRLLFFFTCILGANIVFPQANKYANAFLDIGVGARNLGMAQCVVSSVSDITAGFWNPAGLTKIKEDIQFTLMHNEHFGGIVKYDYGGLSRRFTEKSIGAISVVRSGVDNIPNTLQLIDNDGNIQYENITSFSVADYAFLLSYAQKLGIENLSLGVNAKILHRSIGEFGRGWGFGVDVGLMYILKSWNFGMMARDVTTTLMSFSYNVERFEKEFAITGNEIIANSYEIALPRIVLGVSRTFMIKDAFSIMPEANFITTTDGMRNTLIRTNLISTEPLAGIEFGFKKMVFLRGGVGQFQQVKETSEKSVWIARPNIGAGFKVNRVSIDYALANVGNQSNGLFSHVFSLRLDFNKKPEIIQDEIY